MIYLLIETEDDTSSPIMSNSSMMMDDVKDIQTSVINGSCNVCAICEDRATGKHYGGKDDDSVKLVGNRVDFF